MKEVQDLIDHYEAEIQQLRKHSDILLAKCDKLNGVIVDLELLQDKIDKLPTKSELPELATLMPLVTSTLENCKESLEFYIKGVGGDPQDHDLYKQVVFLLGKIDDALSI